MSLGDAFLLCFHPFFAVTFPGINPQGVATHFPFSMTPAEAYSQPRRHQRGNGVLEKAVIFHFAILLVFTSWAFGGQIAWARRVIAIWGGGGVILFLAACRASHRNDDGTRQAQPALRWLWPLLLYDLFVGVSGLNPSFAEIPGAGEPTLIMIRSMAWLPSSARPGLTWSELWQFNVIVLSCFNLYLVLHRRRLVRAVLWIIGGNAVALAVFGTFQKLVGSPGLWFGAVTSPNSKFFSTFVYHNHWGAFTVLNTSICLGLLYHLIRRNSDRPFWHTPIPIAALALLLLAASIPLSSSRSCTVLMALLLFGAFVHLIVRIIRHRRNQQRSIALPLAGIMIAAVLAVGAIFYLGQEVIAQRAQLTSEQLAAIAKEDTLNSRLTLYRDTWRMALDKPWFGWGLESYAHVFRIYNTQRATELWVWIPFYAEAHNDWLQSLAEVGFVGTALLGALIGTPLFSVRWRVVRSALPRYLLAGVALVLLYAWVEFPFANPAVMIVFWAAFYCALRYASLSSISATDDKFPRA